MAASSSSVVVPFEEEDTTTLAVTVTGSESDLPAASAPGQSEELPTRLELDTHPLLIDHVLDGIFQYFEGDRTNLTSFRLVCKEWSVSAARVVKKSLRWRIGVRANTHSTDAEKDEADFKSMIAGLDIHGITPSSLFRNLHLQVSYDSVGQTQHSFLEEHGHLILDVKLTCDSEFMAALAPGLVLPHTPNLENLSLNGFGFGSLIVPSDLVLPKVTKLKAEANNGSTINEIGIVRLAKMFPNLEDLECEVSNDETLHALYKAWPKLKRLNLGWSRISDFGITGLKKVELDIVTAENVIFDAQFKRKVERRLGVSLIEKPNIGLLADLEHLTVEQGNLSQHSVHLGLVHLKNLEYLKMKAYMGPSVGLGGGRQVPVPAIALADSCLKLAKLDVVGHKSLLDTSRLNWLESTGFCGLPGDVETYVKNKLPQLQLVYDRPSPTALADLERRIELQRQDFLARLQRVQIEEARRQQERSNDRDFAYDEHDYDVGGGGRDYEDFSEY